MSAEPITSPTPVTPLVLNRKGAPRKPPPLNILINRRIAAMQAAAARMGITVTWSFAFPRARYAPVHPEHGAYCAWCYRPLEESE